MKTLTLRNHANTQSMTIKVDIFAKNSELIQPGFETRFTNMVIEDYGPNDQAIIDLRPIENSWQGLIAVVKAIAGIGLFVSDGQELDTTTDQQEDTITISGTSGTAIVSIDGEEYTVTFDTNVNTTAADFVTDHAEDILTDTGVTVTNPSGSTLRFIGAEGQEHEILIANATGNLTGALVNTVLAKTGLGYFTVVAPHHPVV